MSDMTASEAAALVEADRQRRIKLAAEAVQAALAEHGVISWLCRRLRRMAAWWLWYNW